MGTLATRSRWQNVSSSSLCWRTGFLLPVLWRSAHYLLFGSRDAHQNLDFARTGSVAHSFIRKIVGLGSFSVGRWRPTTWYWWNL